MTYKRSEDKSVKEQHFDHDTDIVYPQLGSTHESKVKTTARNVDDVLQKIVLTSDPTQNHA